ncbi:hypothetical protein BUALT_Bualt03G0097200 [Buddleja alternifolia]|uniref:Reverse transcriptase domain-containing protein n=1 Tax=Buddleja alternifolia TaxID=168488 RepID=A0AAV6XU18_9LAMI|nr:hypothetical protein BUALT_Bualt03G0097200 [Buddleja alternifolia]
MVYYNNCESLYPCEGRSTNLNGANCDGTAHKGDGTTSRYPFLLRRLGPFYWTGYMPDILTRLGRLIALVNVLSHSTLYACLLTDAVRFQSNHVGLSSEKKTAWWQALLGVSTRSQSNSVPEFNLFVTKKLTYEESLHMIRPIEMIEIKDVLFSFPDDKPGPDEFTIAFYKKSWLIVGEEISNGILNSFTTERLVKSVNSTIITLIPKVELPTKASDFRPIVCCNVLYKIISKILANRITPMLSKLIDKSQAAFIPGRKKSDDILLAQEVFSGYGRKNLPERCTFKVDLMKAYDTVEWDFLIKVLGAMQFHPTSTNIVSSKREYLDHSAPKNLENSLVV